jgi:DNA (cytosine-5)-methyltransferase 1
VNEPTHIDLFSGIGGFALAAKWAGFRTIAFCEIDKYCQKILAKNFLSDTTCEQAHIELLRSSELSGQPREALGTGTQATRQTNGQTSNNDASRFCKIHSNIFDLDGTAYRGADLLTGGFPCQPFSVAGKRRGAADDRAIWPEMFRVIREARPAWVLGENVPGIIPMELDNVLSDLESIGYACRPFVIPACSVDARHRRDRLWIVGRDMANYGLAIERRTTRTRRRFWEQGEINGNGWRDGRQTNGEWLSEPDVGRVAHGIPQRVDRLKGLGNAIVPQVAYEILREIRKLI